MQQERGIQMVVTNRMAGMGRGPVPTSPISGAKLEYGAEYAVFEWSAGSMGRVIVPNAERALLNGLTALPTRGGVKRYQPTDGRGTKYGVEVRAVIPAQPNRLAVKALMMVSGFNFPRKSYNTIKTVLDSGSWTAFLQSHAGDANVEIYVRDRKTGAEYRCNLATVNPKDELITAIQKAHGTNTNSAKTRKAEKITK